MTALGQVKEFECFCESGSCFSLKPPSNGCFRLCFQLETSFDERFGVFQLETMLRRADRGLFTSKPCLWVMRVVSTSFQWGIWVVPRTCEGEWTHGFSESGCFTSSPCFHSYNSFINHSFQQSILTHTNKRSMWTITCEGEGVNGPVNGGYWQFGLLFQFESLF